MSYSYSLNCGQYVLMDGDRPIGQLLDEVSIALDMADGGLCKLGSPESVRKWMADTQSRLRAGGCSEMADNLVILTGRFLLDELSRCLSTMSYAGYLHQKALAGKLEQMP